LWIDVIQEDVIDAEREGLIDTHTGGSVSLWVEVTEEDFFTQFLQGGSKANAGSSFTDAAFLINDGNNFTHEAPPAARGVPPHFE